MIIRVTTTIETIEDTGRVRSEHWPPELPRLVRYSYDYESVAEQLDSGAGYGDLYSFAAQDAYAKVLLALALLARRKRVHS